MMRKRGNEGVLFVEPQSQQRQIMPQPKPNGSVVPFEATVQVQNASDESSESSSSGGDDDDSSDDSTRCPGCFRDGSLIAMVT
jgi:hypothetical protein